MAAATAVLQCSALTFAHPLFEALSAKDAPNFAARWQHQNHCCPYTTPPKEGSSGSDSSRAAAAFHQVTKLRAHGVQPEWLESLSRSLGPVVRARARAPASLSAPLSAPLPPPLLNLSSLALSLSRSLGVCLKAAVVLITCFRSALGVIGDEGGVCCIWPDCTHQTPARGGGTL